MLVRNFLGVAFVNLFLLGSSPQARADIDSDSVKAGLAAYDALDYERAIVVLEESLTESLTREEQIVSHKTLAFAYAALGKDEQARNAFVKLLRLDDSVILDRTVAPRVRALFEEARTAIATGNASPAARPSLPIVNVSAPLPALKEGQPLSLGGAVTGGVAQKICLFHRARGDLRYSQVYGEMRPTGKFVVTAPGVAVKPPVFEYYLTALDEHGAAVAQSGSYAQPIVLAVSARKPPLYKKSWFWGTIAGVVASGVIIGAVSATRLTESPSGEARVTLIAPR
jgi:tetratricopeptide (TPR) repeat protein